MYSADMTQCVSNTHTYAGADHQQYLFIEGVMPELRCIGELLLVRMRVQATARPADCARLHCTPAADCQAAAAILIQAVAAAAIIAAVANAAASAAVAV